MYEILDETNYYLFAAKHYINKACVGVEEFREDLDRIKSLSRLLSKYTRTGILKDRLILNHLTVLYNVFDSDAMTRMLAFKLNQYLEILSPFLTMMGYWPDMIKPVGYSSDIIDCSLIIPDEKVKTILEKI